MKPASLGAVLVALPLVGLAAGPAGAGEWETARESYDNAVRAHTARIGDIEARERGMRDPDRRAEKLTRDRIAAPPGGVKAVAPPADAAERLAGASAAWRADGPERRALRDSLAALQKNIERANSSLARAVEVVEAASTHLPRSGVLSKVQRLEEEERARAQWQLDQSARERDRLQRERQAGERERGVR